ncbi:MAG: hypothetical protein JOY94_06910 [Methylobacteriaceae bacterium]|nr:hypothetical protein [Methylobacteriaceae bacterium]MBV9219129.1 hypothetical protein [Methylobacteriaceae bacterium]MBV9635215.1 hypothetical protein [Methylobacteriaceae bacterium]
MTLVSRFAAVAAAATFVTVGYCTLALADEVTTTTTTREKPAPGVTVGVPGVVGVEIGKGGGEDCTTRKKTVTDEDTGTSVSKSQTKCE